MSTEVQEETTKTNDGSYLLIKHEDAVKLLVSVGFKTADKWDREKLLRQLNENYEELADGVKAEELDELVRVTHECILEAIKAKKEIRIEGGSPTPKEVKKAEKAKAKGEKPAKAPKEPKAAKEPKPPKEVKAARETAPYVCGQLIAKAGLEVGITDEMVNEFGKLYGRENPYRTWFDMKAAWHAIHAYTESKVENAPQVRVGNTRPALAGKICREKGLNVDLTPEVIAELDKRFGAENEKESMSTLRNAKAAINGYLAKPSGGTTATEEPAAS